MSKTAEQENFPVGRLIAPKLRPLVQAYYAAARQADDIADTPDLSPDEKLHRLAALEKSFYTCQNDIAGQLGRLFAEENLDYRLYADLLDAFRFDARGGKIEIWPQLLEYCRSSAAPVGRFMLAIHNETPSAYLPAETLCAVLQITNHLQDIKSDACHLKRCYLPQQMMQKYNVTPEDLCADTVSPQLRALITEVVSRLRAMLNDARILFCLVQSRCLRAELGVIFSLTNSVLKKIESGDILAKRPQLTKADWFKALIVGIWHGLFMRTKSCNRKLK